MQEVKLQWHSSFGAGLRIELEDEMDDFQMEEELPVIVRICNIMREFAPEYDTTLIYQKIQKG